MAQSLLFLINYRILNIKLYINFLYKHIFEYVNFLKYTKTPKNFHYHFSYFFYPQVNYFFLLS